MDIAAQIIAAIIGIALLALAIAYLLWSVGIMWPLRNQRLLAQSVIGTPGAERLPKSMSFGVFLITGAACIIAFAVADPSSGGAPLTALAALCAIVFLARGAIGFTASWQERTPEEPFRSLDRKTYSPLCLGIGVGFVILVIARFV